MRPIALSCGLLLAVAASSPLPAREWKDSTGKYDRRVDQQIAAMQLIMSGVEAGVTDLWEVYLYPKPGVAALPT